MKFGSVPVGEAEGAVAVHSIRKDGLVLKKGTRIGPTEICRLRAVGIDEVTVARLEPGDVSEDTAAAEIAAAVARRGRPRSRTPSPGASTCSPSAPASWWWTGRRSTASTASTSPLPSRRSRPMRRWSKGR